MGGGESMGEWGVTANTMGFILEWWKCSRIRYRWYSQSCEYAKIHRIVNFSRVSLCKLYLNEKKSAVISVRSSAERESQPWAVRFRLLKWWAKPKESTFNHLRRWYKQEAKTRENADSPLFRLPQMEGVVDQGVISLLREPRTKGFNNFIDLGMWLEKG